MAESTASNTCTVKTSASFHFNLTDVASLSKRLYSEQVIVRGVGWRCFIAPQNTNGIKYLGVAVECNGGTEYVTFLADAIICATLHQSGEPVAAEAPRTQTCEITFTNKSVAGLMEFVEMNSLPKPEMSYSVDDVKNSFAKDPVRIEVNLCVHELRNVCKRNVSYLGSQIGSELGSNIVSYEAGDSASEATGDALSPIPPPSKKRKIFLGVQDAVPVPTTTAATSNTKSNNSNNSSDNIVNISSFKELLAGLFQKMIPSSAVTSVDPPATAAPPFVCLPSVYESDTSATTVLKDQSTQTDVVETLRLASSLDTFLKHLECGVCRGVLQAPIRLCDTGHSFCDRCRTPLSSCPVCRDDIHFGMQNFALRGAIECLEFMCESEGCSTLYNGNDKEKHMLECEHRLVSCIIDSCTWQGSVVSYKDHLESCKDGKIVRPSGSLEYQVPVTVIDEYADIAQPHKLLVVIGEHVFAIKFHATRSPFYDGDGHIQVSVMMFGRESVAKTYSLKLRLDENVPHRKDVSVVRNMCVPIRCDLNLNVDGDGVKIGSKMGVVERGLITLPSTVDSSAVSVNTHLRLSFIISNE